MENNTKLNLLYGTTFSMEYFNKNHWESVEFDFMFTLPLFTLLAGETTEKDMNLYALAEEYNNAKKGKYRIIKDVSLSIGQYNRHYLIAEFEIKQ